ncbi:flagellar biosynthesis protein FlhF [Paenibacillus sp. HB172176]|uniref:flagellar biosynthesis protein FlhF n=1 Tax=Paenibacillus sp. HB172176 TaxID=2493690 RepID=UPI00143A1967|nr:flagellar biosynthesis protein FlhF [Paenibacillus sp. HB172176]
MRVKRYIVNALPEAVTMIRTELGKDAVILDTKEIRVGGFMGMFKQRKMEVIAAIEAGASKESPQQQRKLTPEVSSVVEQILQTAKGASTAVAEPPAPPEPLAAAYDARAGGSASRSKQEQYLENEFRELREFMVKLTKQQQAPNALTDSLQQLKDRLIEQELDQSHVDKLLEALLEREKAEEQPFGKAEVWKLTKEILQEWLQPYTEEGISSEARVIHFVGPTGVGKTTTIAKLAAEQSIKYRKKVGFITSDTYRIAAVDQLRTYANILNVPLEVVFSPMDLPKAYKELESRDLILMDTAGRNFRSELHVSEVNSLLQVQHKSETILVLSLTAKSRDMEMIADKFSHFGIRKVLFTKLDETAVYGSVVNLILRHELHPTYIASGQNVPDDIAPFHLSKYLDLLLGDPHDE